MLEPSATKLQCPRVSPVTNIKTLSSLTFAPLIPARYLTSNVSFGGYHAVVHKMFAILSPVTPKCAGINSAKINDNGVLNVAVSL